MNREEIVSNEVAVRLKIIFEGSEVSYLFPQDEYLHGNVCISRPSMMADNCNALMPICSTLDYADIIKRVSDIIDETIYLILLSSSGEIAFLFISNNMEKWDSERNELLNAVPQAYIMLNNDFSTISLHKIELVETAFAPTFRMLS